MNFDIPEILELVVNVLAFFVFPPLIWLMHKFRKFENELMKRPTFEWIEKKYEQPSNELREELRNRPTFDWIEKKYEQPMDEFRNDVTNKLVDVQLKLDRIQSWLGSELGTDQKPGNVNRNISAMHKDISALKESIIGSVSSPDGLAARVRELEKEIKKS